MSTSVNCNDVRCNDMRLATMSQSAKYGLTYNSPPYNQGEEAAPPSLQPDDVVYDSPHPNQVMPGDPRDPPSNERPPMRDFLANQGFIPQRLVFLPGATQQSPTVPLSERTAIHRRLGGTHVPYNPLGY